MMKNLIILIVFLFICSCSEKKHKTPDSPVKQLKPEVEEPEKKIIIPENLVVQVAWYRKFSDVKRVLEFVDVPKTLSDKIYLTVHSEAKEIQTLPKLHRTVLRVQDKEYKLYPHTIVDTEAMKTYHFEGIYKELYKVWMKHISEVENQ